MDNGGDADAGSGGQGLSRRAFLVLGMSGLSPLVACRLPSSQRILLDDAPHAHLPATSWLPVELRFFTPEQAAEIEAVTARIIPTDDLPGAREAGTVYFIDRALTTFASGAAAVYVEGLDTLQSRTREGFPGSDRFSRLTDEQQIQVLISIQDTPFFGVVRQHTILGFFADPAFGGNQDRVGWEVIGFDDSFRFDPPYGYYDLGFHGTA